MAAPATKSKPAETMAPRPWKSKGLIAIERAIMEEKAATEERPVVVQVVYGDTGTGKTAAIKEAFKGNCFELSLTKAGTIWFDGYKGEEVLLISDFRGGGGRRRYHDLLGLMDSGKKKLDVRWSFTWARWKKVIITSSVHPSQWYSARSAPNQGSLEWRVTDTVGIWKLSDGTVSKVSWDLDEEPKTHEEEEEAMFLTAMPSQASEEAKDRIARMRAKRRARSVVT